MIRAKPTPAGLEILKAHGLPPEVWAGSVLTIEPSRRGQDMKAELHLHSTEEAMRQHLYRIRPTLGARAPWSGFSLRPLTHETLRRRRRTDFGEVVAWIWHG